jgi:uncharacterized protein YdiU (UPF0061 family)
MKSSNTISFENTYVNRLSEICKKCSPVGFNDSEILLKNYDLGAELGINKSFLDSQECLDIFSGCIVPDSSIPLAQAYSGHQYGNFNPQMGDGRAILLGEINKKDIQLKGSGQTPFSKRGDGKSALGPVLREYVISEFMHKIGIPTTRSLLAIKTNENVYREKEIPGGLLTRVAKSHIRIGTFEYVSHFSQNNLISLADYTIERHYPDLLNATNKYLSLFAAICDSQSHLISKWMGVGFVHGVMNTDNMTISGETIDFGPCAFMDIYNPEIYYSSIDKHGRYSYKNQPAIMIWNLTKLAECFIPLVGKNKEDAVKNLSEVLNLTMPTYQEYFYLEMSKKFGMTNINKEIISLIDEFLKILKNNLLDFTVAFRDLSKYHSKKITLNESIFEKAKTFQNWYQTFCNIECIKSIACEEISIKMDKHNPCYIPRNHIIENAIEEAINGDMSEIHKMNDYLNNPCKEQNISEKYYNPTNKNERYVTYCGT